MKNFIFYFILVSIISQPFRIYGQVPEPMNNITTPNVASLGTYGETPVNMYTGQPNISIPLYEVTEDNLKIPLELIYNLSSVKANIHPSWVGLGWNLSCGGQITRAVRGIMDEKQSENGYAAGFYAHCNKMKGITSLEALKKHKSYFMKDVSIDGYELTGDEFSFNFCGYSGKFYLNENKEWTVVSDSDIKVEFNETNGFINAKQLRPEIRTNQWEHKFYCNRFFNQFTLITPNGIRYTFGGRYATEYSISYYSQNTSDLIPTTWYLSKVENTEGKYITLEYEAGTPTCELKYSPWEIYRENIHCSGADNIGTGKQAMSGYLLFPVYIKKINTTFATINFHAVPENEDYKQNPQFLAATATQSQSYSPHRGYYNPPRYHIFFANINLSDIKTLRNGLLNAMIWKRLYGIEIRHNREDTLGNRTIYFSHSHTGNFKKLSRVCEYKGNFKYYSTYVSMGHGVYKEIYILPPNPTDYTPKTYKFYYNTKQLLPETVYACEDHWGYWKGGEFLYTETAENLVQRKGSNKEFTEAETLNSIVYPTGGYSDFEYESNHYTRIVDPTHSSIDETSGTGGGLRVSKIKTYLPGKILDRIKKYQYVSDFSQFNPVNNPNLFSSGILKNGPVYVTLFNTNEQLLLYPAPKLFSSNNKPLNAGTAWVGFRHSGGFMAQSTNDDTPYVGYSSVFEETQDATGKCLGYIRHRYTNFDTDIWGENHMDERFMFATVDGKSYADQFSSKSQERGKLMVEEHYDANKKLLKSISYKYQKKYNTPQEYMPTVHQQTVFLCSEDPQAISYDVLSSAFKTFTYSYLPSESIEATYDLTGKATSKKMRYVYNQNKLLTEKIIYDSQGNELKEKTVYSADLAQKGIGIYENMIKKHILNAVVENTQTKNGYVTASSYIKYEKTERENYKPFATYTLSVVSKIPENALENQIDKNGTPTLSAYEKDKEFTYSPYTDNISCIKDKAGVSTSYLWGYEDRYPVAKFQNATIEEMELALEKTNWLIFEPHIPEEIIENMPELIKNLPKAHISVYGYIPLIGIERFCDSKGNVELYEYDELGRLLRVKDANGKVIKEHKYSYQIPY